MTDLDMAMRETLPSANVPGDSTRYHAELPDFDLYPDLYNRTWVLLDWIGTGKRVLELGCSTGYMSRYMTEKRGCHVTAVEVDEKAAERAARFCGEILVRDLNHASWISGLKPKAFDVVVMGDVLEHLIDPGRVLLEVRSLLARNGSVVICLPNAVHWITRLKILVGRFDYQKSGTLDHTHLRFFTAKTSRRLIESAGYQITKFRPAFGGSLSGHARPLWQRLTNWFPGLFAFQLLYQATMVPLYDSTASIGVRSDPNTVFCDAQAIPSKKTR